MLAMAVLLSGLGIFVEGPRIVRTVVTWTWPTADGVVVDHVVVREPAYVEVRKYGNVTRYENRLRVAVRYVYARASHVTRRIDPNSDFLVTMHPEGGPYPTGAKLTVHVNPDNPDDAVIDDWLNLSEILLFGLSAFGLWWVYRNRRDLHLITD